MYYPTGMGALGCCGGAVPMGADESQASTAGGSATTWISGGILVGLAILVFSVDTKGKRATS
jgi:hypothetical protein